MQKALVLGQLLSNRAGDGRCSFHSIAVHKGTCEFAEPEKSHLYVLAAIDIKEAVMQVPLVVLPTRAGLTALLKKLSGPAHQPPRLPGATLREGIPGSAHQ